MDPWSAAVDEVALEGLDGITIPSLWIRLEDRRPKFPLKFDDCTKELIWKSLLSNDELTFYALPEEREDVVLTDRFKNTDPDTGIETAQKSFDKKKDIYPIHVILENKNGIQGSCAFFRERKDITKHVRSKSLTALVSLGEASERYGRKLVVVASQTVRFRALIGIESDPDVKLNDDSYCLLERVGRARWQGELQSELHGRAFKMDARKLHYVRKSLVRHGLVSMQPHVTRIKSGHQQHSILLLLKRFYVNRKSRYDRLTEQVSNLLQQLPGQFATMMAIKKHLDVTDKTVKRVFQHMRAAKLVEICKIPLEEVQPTAKRLVSKQGNKLFARCVRLLKPYSKKGVADDDDEDDDEDEEDETGTRRRAFPTSGRIMEKDILSQAYQIVLSSGTKGIPKTDIAYKLNIGKQESRMLCRRLERDGFIKGFMEDEGRQRTTKYFSHESVGVSDQLQLLVKEQERNKLLSSAPLTPGSAPATYKISPSPTPTEKGNNKGPGVNKIQKAVGEDDDADQTEQICAAGDVNMEDKELDEGKGKTKRKSGARRKPTRKTGTVPAKQKQDSTLKIKPTPAECETPVCTTSDTSMTHVVPAAAAAEEGDQRSVTSGSPGPQREASNQEQEANNIEEVKDILEEMTPSKAKVRPFVERSQETYRLLRRKNMIVEAVRNFKVIEGLFPLQKMINEEEKQDGVSSKCCKKTIMRIIHSLSREGLLKLYRTTVVQDGIAKKIEIVVHPSIQPSDDVVQQLIEQVRFRISSSYNALCLQQDGEKRREQGNQASTSKGQKKTAGSKDNDDFKPTSVRGLGKSWGFQPKIHRLRIVHAFLWYLIYGHPLQHSCTDTDSAGETVTSLRSASPDAHQEKRDPTADTQTSDGQTQSFQPADTTVSKLEVTSGDEEEQMDESAPACSPSVMKVYADDESWKRYIPPMRIRKEFSSGWAMIGDLLVCLPLSIFIQVIQINYQVDGLEEYLNDPVKQHYLVRVLPLKMRRQLLYKRKYLFAFYESLQRLVFMGLLQFGPMEKFKEKDQIVLYLRRNATIVDTTSAEPHYWLVTESPDKPFERRKYIFNTAEDVENYWFDLMCVCLNTPLGVIRTKRHASGDDSPPPFVRGRTVIAGMAHLLKGSSEACDDGVTPGDGKGAGGLDSEFFAHLKRNWFWTSHLLAVKDRADTVEAKENKIRLKSLLSKNALRLAIKAGGTTVPRCLTTKLPVLAENIVVGIEPATRNQKVVGGKKQKRKRSKKEVVKVPRKKKKEPKKRSAAHDEVDHKALKMMTRQRVYWSVQEDSLMMLCSVASHLLNCKLKRPFIGHCVVRDLLHSEFEISMDKTSVAVGRRTRYILQNPQALLNYRICLAEVYQDKALMRLLEEKNPTDPNKPEDCAEALLEYTRLLRQKFSSAMVACDMIIPDTTQELFSRYKVSAIESGKQVSVKDDLNSMDDIHSIVLHNLIQSTLAMTNSQMKSSRSFQTFHMYSKYNQELLAQVFIHCRKKGLVNRRRVGQAFGPKKNRALPILPMSYQLSQSYYRRFSWRFPHSLCTDSFRFLKSLIDNGTGDDRPVFVFHHETENRSEDGEEMLGRKKGHKRKGNQSGEVTGGQPAGELDAQAEEEKDRSQVEGEKPIEGNMKNQDDCMTPGLGEDPSNKEQPDDHLPIEQPSVSVASNTEPALSEDPPDVSDMMKFSLDSPGAACMVLLSLISLGLMNIYVSIPKQMVLVDSNLVDDDTVKSMATLEEDEDDEDGEECEGRKKMEVKAHQASHTKYLMMRGFCLPGLISVRNLSNNDSIVVESCNIKLQLRNTPAHHMFSTENSPPLDLTKCGPSLLPSILTDFISFPPSSSSVRAEECDRCLIQHRGYTPQDIDACAQLRRSLDEAGEKGLDINDLFQAHAQRVEAQSGCTRSLQQYMKDLQEEGQVLNVGAECVRYVLLQHAEPWLLTVNTKQWSHLVTSDRLPLQRSQHGIPFMSKRRRHRDLQDTAEPPAKKAATDGQESRDGQEAEGRSKDVMREESNEEMQLENPGDEGSGGKELNLNEEVREEDGEEKTGQERVETEEKQEGEVELRDGNGGVDKNAGEAHSPLTAESDADENVSFISRPWRIVDGNLNRLVCKGMLEAVLYHIMSRPGVTQLMLVEHYRDLLQPMAVLDLVQALIEMGCVTKKTLVKCPKPSLFTRSVHQTRSETAEKLEEPDTVFYEPTISCCLRLSQVLPNERHWKYCTP